MPNYKLSYGSFFETISPKDFLKTPTDISPNYNERILKGKEKISLIILHHTATSGANSAVQTFYNKAAEVSAHYLIDKQPLTGSEKKEQVISLVPESKNAWHSGKLSYWNKIIGVNSHSIGIEIVNSGAEEFTEYQYKRLSELCFLLLLKYNIPPINIIGHAEVTPSRKNDPSGYLDWKKLYEEIASLCKDKKLHESLIVSKSSNSLDPDKFSNIKDRSDKFEVSDNKVKELHQELQRCIEIFDIGSKDLKQAVEISSGPSKLTLEDFAKIGYTYPNSSLKAITTAFNRKWCPEIFKKETVEKMNTVQEAKNGELYKGSKERFNKILEVSRNQSQSIEKGHTR